MKDSPDRGGDQWGERNSGYSGYSDPAYASQTPYGPPYQQPAQAPQPTERLPAYPQYGYDPYATGQYPPPSPQGYGAEPPQEPKSPRWLWVVAGVAVVLVIGLVIALVIVNSSRQQTVVAPLPSVPEPSLSTPSPTPTTRAPRTTTRPSTPVAPLPILPTGPTTPLKPPTTRGATDSVVYTVDGEGRAINLTYVDTGRLLQTEFNVMLPWSKEVALPQPGETSASISIINVGREVTCSISVNGVQMDLSTGVGLTICTSTG